MIHHVKIDTIKQQLSLKNPTEIFFVCFTQLVEVSPEDLDFIKPRNEVRKFILNGQIDEAIKELERVNKTVGDIIK